MADMGGAAALLARAPMPSPTAAALSPRSNLALEKRCQGGNCTGGTLTLTTYETTFMSSTSLCTTTVTQWVTIPPSSSSTSISSIPSPTSTATYTYTLYPPNATTTTTSTQYAYPPLPTATSIPSPPVIIDGTPKGSAAYAACACVVAWVTLLYGAVPSASRDLAGALIFLAIFILLFLITLYRLVVFGRFNRTVFINMFPLALFCLLMVIAMGTRAWTSNNAPDINHILAGHIELLIALPLLIDSFLQCLGLICRRAQPGGYIDAGALFLRAVNVAALIVAAVAAEELSDFLHDWQDGVADCSSKKSLVVLPLVATSMMVAVVALGLLLAMLSHYRSLVEWRIVLHMVLLALLLLVHLLWRTSRDVHALHVWQDGWSDWVPRQTTWWGGYSSDEAPAYTSWPYGPCWGVVALGTPNWDVLRHVRQAAESPAFFWGIGILFLACVCCPTLAALVLMAVNLPFHSTQMPPPPAEPDSARYQLCYDAEANSASFKRVDNPGASRLPSGEPLYELVRAHDGSWAVREASASSSSACGLPRWDHITCRPWYS